MKLHRFFYNLNIGESQLRISDREFINQIKNVLRLKKDEAVIFADGKGNESEARLIEVKDKYAEFRLFKNYKNNCEPKIYATLYCSILKRENFEFVVQKAVEAGVSEIVPLVAHRTVKLNLKEDRLVKIIKEAAEQSGRGILPKLLHTIKIDDAIKNGQLNQNMNLFFDKSGEKFDPGLLSGKLNEKNNKVGIFIGPEGGWSKEEISSAKRKKFSIVSMSQLTLRAETAAIIASYLAVHNIA